jgi:hypothetical protein
VTIYSQRYSEAGFVSLRSGMMMKQVEEIIGQPLRRIALVRRTGNHHDEVWHYSDQPHEFCQFLEAVGVFPRWEGDGFE